MVFITPSLHTLAHLSTVSSIYSCSVLVSLFFLTSAHAHSSKPPTTTTATPRVSRHGSALHFVFPLAIMASQESHGRPRGRSHKGAERGFSSDHRKRSVDRLRGGCVTASFVAERHDELLPASRLSLYWCQAGIKALTLSG